ncbi:MAG: HDOD domain-containing protein [Candidatus Krumholzibacteriia bacterium]
MASGTTGMSLDDLRDAIAELPTIPETLTRILQLLEDPTSGARDLADVIRGDAPLASKILRLANSPLYQKNRDITTIQECVSVLGYRTVRQVALCVAVISSLSRESRAGEGILDYRDLWRHSVAVGAVAHALAAGRDDVDRETVFLGGLLHDLGKFVLTICQPRRYAEVMTLRREQGRPLVEVERAELGYDHTAAGATLADAWHFPPETLAMITGHHQSAASAPEVALVAAADYLAHLVQPSLSDLGFDADCVAGPRLLGTVGLPGEPSDELRATLAAAIEDASPLTHLD